MGQSYRKRHVSFQLIRQFRAYGRLTGSFAASTADKSCEVGLCRAIQDAGFGSVYLDSPRCTEVRFEEIASNFLEPRFWIVSGLPTTRNLTGDECPAPQQSSSTTEQFRAFLVVELLINLDGK